MGEVVGECKAQDVANTLWAYATMAREPGERVMDMLERRMGEVVREYKAQDVANTLWAYATMGRGAGERAISMMEGRMHAVVRQFDPQGVANTLWASCVLFERRTDTLVKIAGSLSLCFANLRKGLDASGPKRLHQLHQVFLTCRLEEGLRSRMPPAFLELEERLAPSCLQAFESGLTRPSEGQRDVKRSLERMGLLVEEEARCPRSGYSIDLLVRDKGAEVPSEGGGPGGGGARRWAVEFDGPVRFMVRGTPTGATSLKRRHLRLLGYTLVSVPYWEWAGLRGGDREAYLRGRLYVG
jgi:hypothetical protein